MKFVQLTIAAGLAAAVLVGFGGAASAAPPAPTAGATCANGDAVVNLTAADPATDAGSQLVVTDPGTFVASVIDVPAGASGVVTINGSDQSITSNIACDAPACAEGAVTTVLDDSGVSHDACVASAAAVPPAPAAKATLAPPAPSSVRSTSAKTLPRTGSSTGGLVIAALLVGMGSIASLLGRRKS